MHRRALKEKVLIAINGVIFLLATLAVGEEWNWTFFFFGFVALVNFLSIPFVDRSFLRITIFLHSLNAFAAAVVAHQFFSLGKTGLAWMYVLATAGFLVATLFYWRTLGRPTRT